MARPFSKKDCSACCGGRGQTADSKFVQGLCGGIIAAFGVPFAEGVEKAKTQLCKAHAQELGRLTDRVSAGLNLERPS